MLRKGAGIVNYIFPNLKAHSQNSDKLTSSIYSLIDKLKKHRILSETELCFILDNISLKEIPYLYKASFVVKEKYYQNRVYLRGIIEISNYCKQGCFYCGINSQNQKIERYRLSQSEILAACQIGYDLGYRTFVIQGGEDTYYTDQLMVEIIKEIKVKCADAAITLSLGEKSKESYQKLFDAGADRYLLRHEAASRRLYETIHPKYMSYDTRRECLSHLKEIGYQVGAGFMVGLPTQTNDDLVEDLLYVKSLEPHMVGIGPYLCHEDTPLRGSKSGTLQETLVMVALTRLLLPKVLLPSTTALGSLDPMGREMALEAGANVLMPNISPTENRILYEIYPDKICITDTSGQCRNCIENRIIARGHVVDLSRGDHFDIEKKLKS